VAMPVQGVVAMPVQAVAAMPIWVAVAAMPMWAVAATMCAQVGGNYVPVWGLLVRNDLNGRKKKKRNVVLAQWAIQQRKQGECSQGAVARYS
jgi:hypothetical protein